MENIDIWRKSVLGKEALYLDTEMLIDQNVEFHPDLDNHSFFGKLLDTYTMLGQLIAKDGDGESK